MITLTVKEALENICNTENHYLYLYRNEETIFYVGRSRSPLDRLTNHLEMNSDIGKTIFENLPDSYTWTMEMFTLEDCKPLVQQYCSSSFDWYEKNINNPFFETQLADTAEDAMIAHYSPCLIIENCK